jgi:hypothetical protein
MVAKHGSADLLPLTVVPTISIEDRAVGSWTALVKRLRRIARLKRIWANVGQRLRQIKNGDL